MVNPYCVELMIKARQQELLNDIKRTQLLKIHCCSGGRRRKISINRSINRLKLAFAHKALRLRRI